MKRLLLTADKIVAQGGRWGLLVGGVLILIMGFLGTYGVGARYIFGSPEPYSYEMAVIFLVACILFALPAIQRDRRNLRVDFISNLLPPRGQAILEVVCWTLALVFVSIVIWKGWEIFLSSFRTGETSQSSWEEPLWPMKLMVPIAMSWLWLTLFSQLVHAVIHLVRGTTREDTRVQL
jgi:TRAP-type mannitol/chloroaromatic compound transport system permease small subunit